MSSNICSILVTYFLQHNGFGHSLHTAEKSGSYVPKGDMYPVLGRNNGLNSKEAQRRHALISRILRSVLFICPIDWTGLSHPEDAFDCSFWQQRFSLALNSPSVIFMMHSSMNLCSSCSTKSNDSSCN